MGLALGSTWLQQGGEGKSAVIGIRLRETRDLHFQMPLEHAVKGTYCDALAFEVRSGAEYRAEKLLLTYPVLRGVGEKWSGPEWNQQIQPNRFDKGRFPIFETPSLPGRYMVNTW